MTFPFFPLQYGFKVEKWILSGQPSLCQAPSCPPYWLMFCSPQENCRAGHKSSDTWSLRPRSHSLNSADARRLHHRTVRFVISDSEDEDGYYEDNESSPTEDAPRPIKSKELPRRATPKDPILRVKDGHLGSFTHHCKPESPRSRRGSAPSLQDSRQGQHWSHQDSPLLSGKKNSKKKERMLSSVGSRKFSQNTPPASLSPSRLQKQRPSSAGPIIRNRRQVRFSYNTHQFRIFFYLSS